MNKVFKRLFEVEKFGFQVDTYSKFMGVLAYRWYSTWGLSKEYIERKLEKDNQFREEAHELFLKWRISNDFVKSVYK
jgi:hypothetical protein